MSIPLSLRVGDRNISRRVDDLTFRKSVHGTAEIGFQLAEDLATRLPAFERVYIYDAATADTIAEGRLEDPGRTLDDNGQRWDASAIGEAARASDSSVPLIYIDRDLSRFEREQLERATSASADVSDIPSATGTDGLLMQYNPGQPIDGLSTIVMAYRAIERAGMQVGGVEYTAVAGHTNLAYEYRLFGKPTGLLRQDTWSTTPVDRSATSDLAGATRVELTAPRTGAATNINTDDAWAAFYDVAVKAARYNRDGTIDDTAVYGPGRNVYAHEVVADLLGRLLGSYDGANASIDTSSTYMFDQLAWPDGITPEQVLGTLMETLPDFYYQVGPSDPATGKPSFTWRRWPTSPRYVVSMRDNINLPGADAERYNRVTFRWVDAKGRSRTKTYDAGTTIAGTFVPLVAELETAGPGGTRLVRSPEIQDLADEEGSAASADKRAAEFLLAHNTPPASGTLTVARPVFDMDRGCYVQPYEIEPGHLVFVPELAETAEDYSTTGRNGRCVFAIVGMTYQASEHQASLELDAAPRTDEVLLAKQVNQRQRKR